MLPLARASQRCLSMKHVVSNVAVTTIKLPNGNTVIEAEVTMGSGNVWTFRRGGDGRIYLQPSAGTSRHLEYPVARNAAVARVPSQG